MTTEDLKGTLKGITDTGKETIETAKGRFQNPIIGSLIIATLFFLWKPILFLVLSDKPIENRITYIENRFHYEWYEWLFPLFATAFYVLAVPFLVLWVGKLLTDVNKGISDNDRLQKEHDLLRDIEYEEKKISLLNRQNVNEKIDNLSDKLKNRELEIENLNQQNAEMQEELTERLKKEKQAEKERQELLEMVRSTGKENEALREEARLKYKELKKDFYVFQKSDLYEKFPSVCNWLVEKGGDMDFDGLGIPLLFMETMHDYEKAGIIKRSLGEFEKYEFTEKGEKFYQFYRGIETVEETMEKFRKQTGAGTGRKSG